MNWEEQPIVVFFFCGLIANRNDLLSGLYRQPYTIFLKTRPCLYAAIRPDYKTWFYN